MSADTGLVRRRARRRLRTYGRVTGDVRRDVLGVAVRIMLRRGFVMPSDDATCLRAVGILFVRAVGDLGQLGLTPFSNRVSLAPEPGV